MIGAAVATKVILGVLWAALAAKGALDSASGPALLNIVLNFASLAILIGGLLLAPKALRARTAQAQLTEKDTIIATLEQMKKLMKEELDGCKLRLRDMGFEMDAARHLEASWKARYEEQGKYTAQPALEAIQGVLEVANAESERRHREMLEALKKLPGTAT